MKAAVVEDVNRIVVKQVVIPGAVPGNALIRVAYAGLCGPTDEAILKGLHPRAKFPLILSHEFSGEIVSIEDNAAGLKKSDKVVINPLLSCNACSTCKNGNQYICENLKLIGIDTDGGFAEYCSVPLNNIVPLSSNIPMDVAALSEPMAVGIHAVREAGLCLGESAIVFGAGPIGLFVAEACREAGAMEVTVVEINKKRIEFAREIGYNVKDTGYLNNNSSFQRYDYVFDTTGSHEVLKDLLDYSKIKGTVVIVGKFDNRELFDLHTVLFNELKIIGARVYRQKEFLLAVKILSENPERYKKFISNYFPIDRIDEVFSTFRNRNNLGRIMVTYDLKSEE
jgi:(R,R)-butanediol dehydrogenase / meso-butanediol dehydrogenase / diacetyl reductase